MPSYPTREEIAQRAYEIYVERGYQEGRDVEDWLEAEQQLSVADVETGASESAQQHKTAAAGRQSR
jgi:hypothetical protein